MTGFRQGDQVSIGIRGRVIDPGPNDGSLPPLREVTCAGTVLLASANGRSLMLGFDAILLGHVGMMPVLLGDDGVFRSVATGDEVRLARA
jgi:hypothetical protein